MILQNLLVNWESHADSNFIVTLNGQKTYLYERTETLKRMERLRVRSIDPIPE